MKKLNRSYIIALSLIAIVTITSQVIIQTFLRSQKTDATIINIAGRQRMLSQKITKHILLLFNSEDKKTFIQEKESLHKSFDLWQTSHQALIQGDRKLNLPKINKSRTVVNLFNQVEPHFQALRKVTQKILEIEYADKNIIRQRFMTEISKREKKFLILMNKIVFQYEDEAKSKVSHLKTIETALMIFALLILFLEALLIFKPMIRRIKNYVLEIQHKTKEIKQQFEEIQQTNEELNQTLELINSQRKKSDKLNKSLGDSINYAKNIQNAILPTNDFLKNTLGSYFTLFLPRDVVSGDLYFCLERDNKIILAAVDCTGHGVPGAFMTMIAHSVLTDIIVNRKITQADKILERLHLGIRFLLHQKENKNRDGMDIALTVIDKKNKILEFAGAKLPLIYIQDNELKVIKGNKLPIGGEQKENKRTFTKHDISIEKETTLYLFSDGFQDQFGGKSNRKFGSKRLRDLLLEHHQKPVLEQKTLMKQVMEKWREECEEKQTDDILLIGVRLS